ncbi:MAG: DEAD/DEAH box helicase [Clostridia bacterium]|nr:DEAD/DEAH box helicase [Clostridia bacterium]
MANPDLSFFFTEDGFALDERGGDGAETELQRRFREDRFGALYDLGFQPKPKGLDAAGQFLYQVADAYLEALTGSPDLEVGRGDTEVRLSPETLRRLADSVPFTLGSQFVTPEWIEKVAGRLHEVFQKEIADWNGSVSLYLSGKSQHLRVKERIFFHLVERKDAEFPFGFLATYATRDGRGRLEHVPLRYALEEYRGDRDKLVELLSCLNRAAETSPLLGGFMSSGELFHPLRLTADEAYEILKAVPAIEEGGIVCRIPNWWRKKARGLGITVRMGGTKDSFVGLESIVSVRPAVTVDGEPLTKAEIARLLRQSEGLAFIKGKWVEVNHERLRALLDQVDELGGDLTLLDAMRLGLEETPEGEEEPTYQQTKWLGQLIKKLRDPRTIREAAVPKTLQAELRPYQETGYTWLDYMGQLGLGACLADDMGLGKTVQVLAFLERYRQKNPDASVLLVVPASLLGNWEKEAQKFAPDMPIRILHGRPAPKLAEEFEEKQTFLTVTTYGMATRLAPLKEKEWDVLILDEAQAIKNPKTKQSRELRAMKSRHRIALTGTPIENDLVNLWALFDFLNHGLLGSMTEFRTYSKNLAAHPEGYAKLKNLIAPFMLRRMKTDKSIIADLPEKIEETDYVTLSAKQAVLYEKVVSQIEDEVRAADEEGSAFRRSGIVLRAITKLKQICNHPSQYLGQPVTKWNESGKFAMLGEICRTIAENRERVLVFTQFREIIPALDDYLAEVFGVRGFVLHGETPVAKRQEIVDAFQSERYFPYVVLSVKAGGTGLNLTGANHVVHFDRWWNPAVENQATDRAFRIGQEKNVMVHKLVAQGTIEERIDAMIASKKELAENVIGSGEQWITDLPTDELLSMMQLSR